MTSCRIINHPNVVPSWVCCGCRHVNAIDRGGCKVCKHGRCTPVRIVGNHLVEVTEPGELVFFQRQDRSRPT